MQGKRRLAQGLSMDVSNITGPDETLLALNNAHAAELSLMTSSRFAALLRASFVAWRIGTVAMLLAFDQDADYDSENFLWFRARYPRFVYVDRVVVAAPARGLGLARRLYKELFQAAEAGHGRIVCEVNAEPPNPASDAFHAAIGFAQVGIARLAGGEKMVRYFCKEF